MYERFADLGVDMATDAVEVAPTAHYGMGGVVVDGTGETDIDGLYAIGETMAGVHGANRLGGNSLAETIAFGAVAGEAIARRLERADVPESDVLHDRAAVHFADLRRLVRSDGTYDPEELFDELRGVMWEHAGILRDEASLSAGLERVASVRRRASDLAVDGPSSRSFEYAMNLAFALDVAESVFRSAAMRTESRGAHARTDHTGTDADWQRNIRVRRDGVGAMRLATTPVSEPSDEVQAALDAGFELDYHQLE
jgi:succinate dehydrogenase / fumarate reductase flavoprotein subunit